MKVIIDHLVLRLEWVELYPYSPIRLDGVVPKYSDDVSLPTFSTLHSTFMHFHSIHVYWMCLKCFGKIEERILNIQTRTKFHMNILYVRK